MKPRVILGKLLRMIAARAAPGAAHRANRRAQRAIGAALLALALVSGSAPAPT